MYAVATNNEINEVAKQIYKQPPNCKIRVQIYGLTQVISKTPELEKLDLATIISSLQAFKNTVVVTAFSNNHFDEAVPLINQMHKLAPLSTVIYSLDGQLNVTLFQSVQIKRAVHPPENIKTFVWKPQIIGNAMKEHPDGYVLYGDSSTRLNVEALLEIILYMELHNLDVLGRTTAGVLSEYTHPQSLKCMKISRERAKIVQVVAASTMIWAPKSMPLLRQWNNLLKPPTCLAPVGATPYHCKTTRGPGEFKGCHRYDQSFLTYLFSQWRNARTSAYFSNRVSTCRTNCTQIVPRTSLWKGTKC